MPLLLNLQLQNDFEHIFIFDRHTSSLVVSIEAFAYF